MNPEMRRQSLHPSRIEYEVSVSSWTDTQPKSYPERTRPRHFLKEHKQTEKSKSSQTHWSLWRWIGEHTLFWNSLISRDLPDLLDWMMEIPWPWWMLGSYISSYFNTADSNHSFALPWKSRWKARSNLPARLALNVSEQRQIDRYVTRCSGRTLIHWDHFCPRELNVQEQDLWRCMS